MDQDRSLIKIHSSAIVKGLIEQANSISKIDHNLLKGELREIFVSNILRNFLTSQFDIGSGVIVNQRGDQSGQIDIIIYAWGELKQNIKNAHNKKTEIWKSGILSQKKN